MPGTRRRRPFVDGAAGLGHKLAAVDDENAAGKAAIGIDGGAGDHCAVCVVLRLALLEDLAPLMRDVVSVESAVDNTPDEAADGLVRAPSKRMQPPLLLMLRGVVDDVVVVAFVRNEDVLRDLGSCRSLERPHRDADPFVLFLINWIEEQRRPTPRAEPTTDLLGGMKPGDVFCAAHDKRAPRNVAAGVTVTRPFAAHRAVTDVWRWKLHRDFKGDVTTQT